MFQICSKIDKVCSFSGFSNYNPQTKEYDKVKRNFCGVASGFDTLVSSLPDCWLEMSKSQRSTYIKNKKNEYISLNFKRRK
tara:strand:- start:1009 stop:1251 length:243 start_codon:yes stop_codon:yes gene_type:complete